MESGLEGRNNESTEHPCVLLKPVSMESGLEGRNNLPDPRGQGAGSGLVSMESGLEGRNNLVPQRGEGGARMVPSQWSPA